MRHRLSKHIKIARLLLLVWSYNLFFPSVTYALTSGPVQPETQAFQQASVSDMVDLQTGDFKYNIPLLDIDGYPINLNYQSGVGIDDEASWVGLGWNLNTGAINRQLRGLPDDMKGDIIHTEDNIKPMVTVGGRVSGKLELLGYATKAKGSSSNTGGTPGGTSGATPDGGITSGKSFKLGATLTYGVFFSNYTGIGAEVSVNPGISLSLGNSTGLNAGLGFGISSNTQSGANISPYASLALYKESTSKAVNSAGLTASLGYNSRSGLKSLALGTAFSSFKKGDAKASKPDLDVQVNNAVTTDVSYNTEPIMPRITTQYNTHSESYSIDIGPATTGIFGGAGLTGYRTEKSVKPFQANPGYGFLYADYGKDNPRAVMDFIREKESIIVPELPNLAVPIQTHDLFSFTNQIGSGQFRLYRGGTGIFFDNFAEDTSDDTSLGLDLGFGNIGHAGVTFFDQKLTNKTGKWVDENRYLPVGDHQTYSPAKPNYQNVSFKLMGEKIAQDEVLAGMLGNTQAVKVEITDRGAANAKFLSASSSSSISGAIINTKRQPTGTVISYLTAGQAELAGLDKKIKVYKPTDETQVNAPLASDPVEEYSLTRVDPTTPPATDQAKRYPAYKPSETTDRYPARKTDHISEITVTDGSGRRMVYGVPVYNVEQSEFSFAIGGAYDVATQGTTGNPDNKTNVTSQAIEAGTPGSTKGTDNYYHKEGLPPYATSYLLSGVLSADYLDRTGDGITNDDLGTAIKFNYSRVEKLYNWRAPFNNVTINRGQLATPDDDKGSVIYGQKELWYVSSIESKTKIAYFITKDRLDGLGVGGDWKTGEKNPDVKQKCLVQIRLYSKADMTKPIKVVKFDYNYELCPFTPNSAAANGGKLTLKSVWFEYANVAKGANHPYKFSYKQPETIVSAGVKGAYGYMLTDRWGVYKSRSENITADLSNEEFPYSNQNKATVSDNVSLWHLNKIELPTGGTIDVTYETDDYAYVQDKKAMCMYKIDYLTKDAGDNETSSLKDANGIKVTLPNFVLPTTVDKAWFVKNCLNGSDYLYGKYNVKMNTSSSSDADTDYDFISSFAEVESVSKSGSQSLVIKFKSITESGVTVNPIAMGAWQRLKNEYPGFAYPGYDNRANKPGSPVSVITATVNALGNIRELTRPFYEKAKESSYANKLNTNKSFIRLSKNDGDKVGGGVRVERVVINDNWNTMSTTNQANRASYGQQYIYKLENGQSSGVASYEPTIGNDENPFKLPIPYVQKTKGAVSNFFQLEEPFGESVFPSPGVTYSRVVVRDLIKTENTIPTESFIMAPDPAMRTGYIVNEYYTTKDFPVKVNVLDITTNPYNPKSTFSFIITNTDNEIYMSQGYSIELNDMNGKLKATRVFKETGTAGAKTVSQVSATEYFYKTEKKNGEKLTLNNKVKVVDPDGTVKEKTLGQEIDLFTDFRQQESENDGLAVNLGSDFAMWGPFPAFLPHLPIKVNSDYTLFRSACAFKVVQSYGILESVVNTQDGSSITTENIAYDGLTGEALVTRTQNEFNKDIYSVNIPAYWAYTGMSGAYKNLGMMIGGLQTSSDGALISSLGSYLAPGDVIQDLSVGGDNELYWVVDHVNDDPPYGIRLLMNRSGKPKKGYTMKVGKIVRSGYRNVLDASVSSFTCLTNPITSGPNSHLQFADDVDLTALKVINASASVFDENWAVEVPDIKIIEPETTVDWTYRHNTFTHYDPENYHEAEMFYSPSSLNGWKQTWEGVVGMDIEDPDVNGNYFWRSRAMTASISPYFLSEGDVSHCFSKVNITTAGDYFIGVNSNVRLSLAFDDDPNLFTDFALGDLSNGWFLFPHHFDEGQHVISMVVTRGENPDYSRSAFGVEIYNNSEAEIKNQYYIKDHLNIVWTTSSMTNLGELHGEQGLYLAPHVTNNAGVVTNAKYYWTDVPHNAYSPVNRDLAPGQRIPDPAVNPYLYGLRGNWRLANSMTTLKNRAYKNLTDRAVDVKNAGYITGFRPYWTQTIGSPLPWMRSLESNYHWTTTNTVTQYDKYGQQLENKDALGRYSAAKFGFNGELPSAVASNAMLREIYTESFEDARFVTGRPNYIEPEKLPYFTPADLSDLKGLVTGTVSHSGNNSVQVASDLMLSTHIFSKRDFYPPFLYWEYTHREYEKLPEIGRYPKGFEPVADTYLFNAWIKDSEPNSKSFKGIKLYSGTTEVTLTVKAIVEGWKLVEGVIDLKSYEQTAHYGDFTGIPINFKVVPNGSNVYMDDIRIHPQKSSMKTYAYDEKTMRLMAELDENCFATFYEYDSQGLLVRVKKETERGIMTLKESRSSYKKGL